MAAHAFNSKRCVYLCEFQASQRCILRLQRKEGREGQRREGQKEGGGREERREEIKEEWKKENTRDRKTLFGE